MGGLHSRDVAGCDNDILNVSSAISGVSFGLRSSSLQSQINLKLLVYMFKDVDASKI